MREVDALEITVPVLPWDDLLRRACDSYNAWNAGNEHKDMARPDSDHAFLDRICVNYLRHELTDYERELAARYGKVGVRDATDAIREKVYDAIADAYPGLAVECVDQWSRRLSL